MLAHVLPRLTQEYSKLLKHAKDDTAIFMYPCSSRRSHWLPFLLTSALMLTNLADATTRNGETDFTLWLQGLRKEALQQGISTQTLDHALKGVRPIERVIELDHRQPEFTETFWNYLRARVTPHRIATGKRLLQRHHQLLQRMARHYGVPPRYLVAFWGLETNFGKYQGRFPTVNALVTLAYDPRRGEFFRVQALDALRILDQGHITANKMKGSWAGAIGQLQFMPSTFLANAVDGDNDGKKDVWSELPDVFASGANYLHHLGWRKEELWGREVQLPRQFDWQLTGLKTSKSLKTWSNLGVKRANGAPLPKADMQGAIVLPQGHEGPAFLVYNNFQVILKWNRAINYAIAVGHLADRMIGLPAIRNGRQADNRRLSYKLALELQQRLNALGFASGEPDGVPGARTRQAVRAYQQASGLPTDGYPSVALLEQLRRQKPPE